ncbi:hypothetical protein AHAS_Ahas07G0098600 [Arachis hypogaea]
MPGGTQCIFLQIHTPGSYGSAREFLYSFPSSSSNFLKEASIAYEYFKNKTSFVWLMNIPLWDIC